MRRVVARHATGFTLLEMLVVLAIMGLMAALVLPGLGRTAERMERATARRSLITAISTLGQRANALGQNFTLDGKLLDTKLADGRPMLDLPEGWSLHTADGIQFSFAGICSGGQVDIVDPDGQSETIKLPAPTCVADA